MAAISKGFHLLEKWLNVISVSILTVMMLMVTANVFGRYIFNEPIESTLEFTEFFMVAIVYMGLAYTQFLKANINIELLTSRLSGKKRSACDLVSYLACFALFALIVWHGTRMFIDSWEMREITMGTVELPVYPSKLLVPVGSLIVCVRFLIDIVEVVKTLIGRGN